LGLLRRIDLVRALEDVVADLDIVLIALENQLGGLDHLLADVLAVLLAGNHRPGAFEFLQLVLGIIGSNEETRDQCQKCVAFHDGPPFKPRKNPDEHPASRSPTRAGTEKRPGLPCPSLPSMTVQVIIVTASWSASHGRWFLALEH